MSFQEKLNVMKKEYEATLPPEILAIFHQATDELIQSGIADKAIKVGAILPEFSLSDEKGNLITSKVLLAKGPLAISFYRGVW